MEKKVFVKKLMGRPGRLDVAAWIAALPRDSYFSQRDAQVATQLGQPEVRQNLEDLVAVKLLRRFENRWPSYQRVDSPVWRVLAKLQSVVAALEAGEAEPRLDRSSPARPAATERPVNLPPMRSRRRNS
jgi:hypothetical protein